MFRDTDRRRRSGTDRRICDAMPRLYSLSQELTFNMFVNYSGRVDVFDALADPTRRRVVQLLGVRRHRAGELADATGMSRSAMSRHLKILLTTGMIEDERVPEDARIRMFKLQPESLVAVQAFLDQLQAEWRTQLGSFKRHVEAKTR